MTPRGMPRGMSFAFLHLPPFHREKENALPSVAYFLGWSGAK